jgi:small subunit ribosomal protein S20
MPQHKSNEKRMRTSTAARTRNRVNRSQCRVAEKRVLQAQNKAEAGKFLLQAYKVLDSMATKGVIHANTASRHKAKLSRHVNSLQTQ